MDKKDVVNILRDFISNKFPMECSCCGKRFDSLAEYLRNTTHVGKPISYDADLGNWRPFKPLGTLSLANCSCGTTLAISSAGMDLITFWKLMKWARKEIKKQGIDMRDLLNDLREAIDKSVLDDEENSLKKQD